MQRQESACRKGPRTAAVGLSCIAGQGSLSSAQPTCSVQCCWPSLPGGPACACTVGVRCWPSRQGFSYGQRCRPSLRHTRLKMVSCRGGWEHVGMGPESGPGASNPDALEGSACRALIAEADTAQTVPAGQLRRGLCKFVGQVLWASSLPVATARRCPLVLKKKPRGRGSSPPCPAPGRPWRLAGGSGGPGRPA